MNYEQPREIKEGPNAGKWHWTTRNDNTIRASGYCSSWETCPSCHGMTAQGQVRIGLMTIDPADDCSTCENRGIVQKTDPCPGHETAEEAAEHFRQYRIDRAEFVVVNDPDAVQLNRCKMCEKFTASYMHIPGEIHTEIVCPDHHNREALNFLIETTMGFAHS